MPLSRRDFTARTVIAGAGVALTGTVAALATAPGALAADDSTLRDEQGRPCEPGYGPLRPDPAGILALPAGFRYRVITHSGVTKLVRASLRLLETGKYPEMNVAGAEQVSILE
ncbi:hypothetical protein ACFRUQ_21635, partial [Streptomyces goshikiensis]